MEAQPLPFTPAGRRPVQGPGCPGRPGHPLQGAHCRFRAATCALTTSCPEGPTASPRGPSEPQRLHSQKAIESQALQVRRRQGRNRLKILSRESEEGWGLPVCFTKEWEQDSLGLRGQMMARLPSPRVQHANSPVSQRLLWEPQPMDIFSNFRNKFLSNRNIVTETWGPTGGTGGSGCPVGPG